MPVRKWPDAIDEKPVVLPEEELVARIPAPLLEKLTALKPVLEQQGSVQFRPHRIRTKAFRVRYRIPDAASGRIVQKTLQIGADGPAYFTQELLRLWQAARKGRESSEREAEAQHRAEIRTDRRRWQLYKKVVQFADGGGPRQRRRVGKQFDSALAAGPFALFAFTFKVGHLPQPKPGRPRKGRLW